MSHLPNDHSSNRYLTCFPHPHSCFFSSVLKHQPAVKVVIRSAPPNSSNRPRTRRNSRDRISSDITKTPLKHHRTSNTHRVIHSVVSISGSFRPARHAGNNIFGTDPEPGKPQTHGDKSKSTVSDAPPAKPSRNEESGPSTGTLAGQYKQNQMKSSIFGNDEPAASRQVSDKNRSNIFGATEQEEQNKRQGAGGRQGVRGKRRRRNGSMRTRRSVDENWE